jgi:hypothetical protein
MARQSWREWNLFVLNGNKVYCSIIFAEAGSASVPEAPADSARPHRSFISISRCKSRHRHNLANFGSAQHERQTRPVKRDGHWLLY